MVRNINADWQTHVNGTGVTCYTCHRGQPVPANVWFNEPGRLRAAGLLGNNAGQNDPIRGPDNSSLPYDSVHAVPRAGQQHPRGRHDRPARHRPQVDQADRVDLRPDDPLLDVAWA